MAIMISSQVTVLIHFVHH